MMFIDNSRKCELWAKQTNNSVYAWGNLRLMIGSVSILSMD